MRLPGKIIFGVVLLMAVLLMSGNALAQEQSQGEKTAAAKNASADAMPDLDKIIPLSTELHGRLSALEKAITGLPDVSEQESRYNDIEARLKHPADRIQRLRDSKDYRYMTLIDLRQEIEHETELLKNVSEPLRKSISQLGSWRKEWLAEKERWRGWQSSMRTEGEPDQIKSAFSKATDTIDRALKLINTQLETMLTVQAKAGNIQEKMKSLAADVDGMLVLRKRSILFDESPPMLSSRYFSQFRSGLWDAAQKGMDEISWPGRRFFDRHGWIVFLQGFLVVAVIIAVYRNRRVLHASERWRVFAARPFAAGLFLGFMTTAVMYEYQGVPVSWKLANAIITGISFSRLIGGLIEKSWKRQFVYCVVIVFCINRLLFLVSLPLPLVRLYVVLTALLGFFLCLLWARESGRRKEPGRYIWLLRLVSLFLAVVVMAALSGKKGLSLYLFGSLIDSFGTVLVIMLFMYIIHGGVEWLFRTSALRRVVVLYADDTDAIIRRQTRFIDVAACSLLLLPAILRIWGVYDSLEEAMKGLLAFGINVGAQRLTIGLVIVAASILYGSFLISWLFQKLFIDKVLVRRHVEKGIRLSIGRLVHYAFIFAGFLLAISILGIEITKLTIMLSALGVGIGFGLQGAVNNLVSGLILLFERPIRVGDFIELGGIWSEVRRIGLRSTTVQTFDSSDVIIPNADLISNQVTNWTLSNRRRRIDIPVGVAYGSDISLVMETLMACAGGNPMLAETPGPQVLFLRFGESSLDFELRVFVSEVRNSMNVISELHQEIDRRFREAKIEIAFPQRDLHVRSIDESVVVRPPETGK